jgi:stage II sporulation protein D
MMRRIGLLFFAVTLLLARCATNPSQPKTPDIAPAPARPVNKLEPLARAPREIAAPLVRVGLLTDQATVSFPRIPDGYIIVSDREPYVLRRGFTDFAPAPAAGVHYTIQVAALSDRESAGEVADRVRRATSLEVDRIFDAGLGLFKVLAGDAASEAEARPLRQKVEDAGFGKDLLIVKHPSDRPFRKVHGIVDDEGNIHELEGDSLLVLPYSGETVTIGSDSYRGGARLFINSRGLLNVSNELNLEDYVRGVVPNEMGPKIFDEVEGLKAQALAARTYVIKRMGDFRSEGYDICATPACQVYKGFSSEDPLSDQAVKETAGQIITYNGAPIDALYTSTCGGETSDVSTMFPPRNEPYLARTRCVEAEMRSLPGRDESALLDGAAASARLFTELAHLETPSRSWAGSDVVKAISAALSIAGVKGRNAAPPPSSRRGDVLTYLGSVLDLSASGRALTLPEDRNYYFPSASADDALHQAAAFLIRYRIIPMQAIDEIDLDAAMPREELFALLYSWLQQFQAVQEASGKLLRLDDGELEIKSGGKTTKFAVPGSISAYRRLGDRWKEYRQLPVMIGDRLSVIRTRGGSVFAIVVQASSDGAGFDRTSSFANWTRSYRADELVASISKRNVISQLLGLDVVSTDASQRVRQMTVTAEGGRKVPLEGIVIRWSLNLPDNLFVFTRSQDSDGVDRYTFFGKGWGHGTGLCQAGAYGMAFRGWTAEQIVKHYYTGVEITKLK